MSNTAEIGPSDRNADGRTEGWLRMDSAWCSEKYRRYIYQLSLSFFQPVRLFWWAAARWQVRGAKRKNKSYGTITQSFKFNHCIEAALAPIRLVDDFVFCRLPNDGEVWPHREGVRHHPRGFSGARLLQQLPLLPTTPWCPGVSAHQVSRLARQMEHYWNPLDLFHASICKRA